MKRGYRRPSTEFCRSSRTTAPASGLPDCVGRDKINDVFLVDSDTKTLKSPTRSSSASVEVRGGMRRRRAADRRSMSQYGPNHPQSDQECDARGIPHRFRRKTLKPQFAVIFDGEAVPDANVFHVFQ